MKKIIYLFSSILFTIFCVSCKSEENSTQKKDENPRTEATGPCPRYILENKKNNLNISVFLDLSDRITEPKIIQKDIEYLQSISEAFTDHVKTKKLILLQDKIQLYFNPEPTNNVINNIAEKLHIEFDKNSSKAKIEETQNLYAQEPLKLYELAQADFKEAKDYPGSDIWRFFKDNVKDYTISDCHRNLLVILTDGYMYHKNTQMTEDNKTSFLTPNSLARLPLNNSAFVKTIDEKEFGFIKATDGLEDLEVLVIGIHDANPNNPYAMDIIRAYWENWFTEMGVETYKIQNADLASNVDKVIKNFLNP
ncbi:hypothetical protein [Maribacter flavus]|uniref:VWA domain-containing protein n=1 Tax=Maribacter flavus TaxID=1658664 RepID=A0A5B2TRD5_9FLAO|nr:hypothetical protein [Maribacter flavus]KAA2217187.1 hypothetical protein F0361_14585 [Maribacter flavus]